MSKQRQLFQAWVDGFDTHVQAYNSIGISKETFYRIMRGRCGISPTIALLIEQQSRGSFRKEKLVWGDAA